MSEWQQPEIPSMVSSAQSIDKGSATSYERHVQTISKPKTHRRNSEMDYIDYEQDDDRSIVNRLPNTYDSGAVAALNPSTVDDDFVDNVSTSDPSDSTFYLRRRIPKNARETSPKMHCSKPTQSAPTCDFMQPTTALREMSANYDRIMSALHRPQFASGVSMKKIVFNGTFPIDDPYSSRFDYDGSLLQ